MEGLGQFNTGGDAASKHFGYGQVFKSFDIFLGYCGVSVGCERVKRQGAAEGKE